MKKEAKMTKNNFWLTRGTFCLKGHENLDLVCLPIKSQRRICLNAETNVGILRIIFMDWIIRPSLLITLCLLSINRSFKTSNRTLESSKISLKIVKNGNKNLPNNALLDPQLEFSGPDVKTGN